MWCYLHFYALQMDLLESQLEPNEICERAIVDSKKQNLLQLNSAAIKAGLSIGMGLASAASLCAQLEVFPYQIKDEEQALHKMAEVFYDLCPDLILIPPASMAINTKRMRLLYEEESSFWQRIKTILIGFDYRIYYASADTLEAAKILALAGAQNTSTDLALIKRELFNLPLVALPVSLKQIQSLSRAGFKTLGQVLSLPKKELSLRFEPVFVKYLLSLEEDAIDSFEFYVKPQGFSKSIELSYEIYCSRILIHPLRHLLVLLEGFLLQRNSHTHSLILTLKQRNGLEQKLTISSAEAEIKAAKWLKLAELCFERLTLSSPVIKLGLDCQIEKQKSAENLDLFSKSKQALKPNHLLSFLQAKLGKEQVVGLSYNNDHRPECAHQEVALLISKKRAPKTKASSPKTTSHIETPLLRPSYLLTQPAPICDELEVLYGPERIQSGWWDGQEFKRDYFIARNNLGQHLWIFRQANKQWFIHGYFA